MQEIKIANEGGKAEQEEQAADAPDGTTAASGPQNAPSSEEAQDLPTTVAGGPPDMIEKSQDDTPDVPLRFVEKKRLHWTGKTCKTAPQLVVSTIVS